MEKTRALDAEIIYQSAKLSNLKTSATISSDQNLYRPCRSSYRRKRESTSRSCRCDCECKYHVCYCDSCIGHRCHYKSSSQQCLYENVDEIPVRDEESYNPKRLPDTVDDKSEGATDRDKFIRHGELYTVLEGDKSEATIRTASLETQSSKEKQSVQSQTDSEPDHEDLIQFLVKSILEKLKAKDKVCKQDEAKMRDKCRYIVERLFQAIGDSTSCTDISTSKEEILASYNYSEKAIHTKSENIITNNVQPNDRKIPPLVDKDGIALNNNVVAFNDNNKIEIGDRIETMPNDKLEQTSAEEKRIEITNSSNTYQIIVEELLNKCIDNDKVREISCTIEHLGPDMAPGINTNSSQIHSTVKVRMLKNPNFEYDNRLSCRNYTSSENTLKTSRQFEKDSRKIHSENDVYISTHRSGEDGSNDLRRRSGEHSKLLITSRKAKKDAKRLMKSKEYITMVEDTARNLKAKESGKKKLHIEDSTIFARRSFCATLCMCLCRMLGKNC